MGLKDAHDPREFTTFAKFNADGAVAALVEVADSALAFHNPNHDGGCYVDVSEFRRSVVDVYALKLAPETITHALTLLPDDRISIGTDVRTAIARALPDALAETVFGPSNADHVR